MSLIPNPSEFQPSAETRRKWLSTRKTEQRIGVLNFPGFYGTTNYSSDRVWFFIALGVEIIALLMTIFGGFNKGSAYGIGAIVTVVLFVMFDVIGSNLVHKNQDLIQILKNKILIDRGDSTIDGHHMQIRNYKQAWTKFMGVFLIFLSAILKLLALFLLNRFHITLIWTMTILYFTVVYIHWVHTGYYISERRLRTLFRKEYKQFALAISNQELPKEDNIAKKGSMPFSTNIELSLDNFNGTNQHSIILMPDQNLQLGSRIIYYSPENNGEVSILPYDKQTDKFFNYNLITKGLITDDNIIELTQGQNSGQSTVIALACLQYQIQNN
jgi:hypothetical protein